MNLAKVVESPKARKTRKEPKNSKIEHTFGSRIPLHPQPSSCLLFRVLHWKLNLCKMPAEMLSLPERGVGREGNWSGQRPRKTHHIWHFKWLFLRYEKLRFVSALSPVFPTSCKVFTSLSTFWVECILTHTRCPAPLGGVPRWHGRKIEK